MKKLLLSAFTLIASCFISNAQTGNFGANYKYQINSGTYTALTTPTVLSSGAAMDDAVFTVTLSTPFNFNGANTPTLIVSENGYVSIGTDPASYNPLSNSVTGNLGVIAPFARDLSGLDAASSLSYIDNGTDITFQWSNIMRYTTSLTGRDALNFQLKLNYATGNISVMYGAMTTGSAVTTYPQVGVRSTGTTWSSGVNNLTIASTTGNCSWANALTGSVNNSTMYFNTANAAVVPASGLQYIWTPSTLTPPVRTIAAVSAIGTTSVVLNYTQPAGTPTGYNVQYRPVNSCAWTNAVGNPFAAAATLTLTGLTQNTNYEYRIQAIYTASTSIYSHVPAAFTTLATCPPTSNSTVTAVGSNSAVATWTVNGTETAWDVFYGPTPLTAPTATTVPTATTSVNNFTFTGLNPVTGYAVYVRANCGAGDMSTWAGPRAFTTTALATDLQALQLVSPVVNATGCYGTHTVTVRIKNTGASILDFSTNNATVIANITGVNPQSYTATVTTGTLAATTGTMDVVVTTSYNMSAVGTRTFNATATLATPDLNAANNAITAVTYTTSGPATLPQLVNFTGYTGTPASISTLFPGWNEGVGAVTPTIAGDGSFLATTAAQTTSFTAGAKMNLYNTNTGWIISPKVVPTAAHVFKYKATVLNYDLTTAANLGANDTIRAMVSNNCGATWTALRTFNTTTNQGLNNTTNILREYTESLAAYAGQEIMVAIYARRSPTGTTPDIDILVDDLQIDLPPACPVPTGVTVANTPTTAVATWTAGGSETAWDVYYGPTPLTAPSASTAATATSSSTSFSLTGITPSTGYAVYVRANCGSGNISIWTPVNAFTTPCLPPNVLTTTGSTRCGTGTTTLSATADMSGTLVWYQNPTGGSPLTTGSILTTPTISTTTNYYVSAVGNLVSENVGRASAASASGFLTTPNWGVVFNTTKNVLVNSATIYPVGTGSVTIALLNAAGTELASTPALAVTGTGTNSPVVVNLGFNVPTGNDYKIVLKAYTGITDLIRDGSPNAFPYNSASGAVSVTGGWTGTATSASYYWFYNLNVSSGCESARSMVTATVTSAPVLSITSGTTICANVIKTLNVTSTLSDYNNYVWSPVANLYTDASATTPYTGGSASTLYYSSATTNNSNYTINASNTVSGCVNTSSVGMSVTIPSIVASANPTIVCSGASVNLNATGLSPATGTIAVGNATTVTSATGELTAFCNRRVSYRMQSVYTAAELTALGLSSGNITSIAYNITSIGDAATNALYTVKMGTTSVNAFTDFISNAGFATVYNPATYTHSVGINTINFNTPYAWDGVSNIAIEVTHDGIDNINNAQTYYTATAGNMIVYSYDGNTTGTPSLNRLNIIINGQKNIDNTANYTWQWNPGAVNSNTTTVIATNTGSTTTTESYTVTALDPATTCTNSAMVSFSVSPIPNVMAMTSNTAVCAGSPATLTAMGATNYTWTAAGTASTQVANPTAASVYTVTGETAGCTNTATVSVGVNAVPVVSAIASQTLLCDNGSTGASILTASTTATTYLWSDGAMTMTTSVTPTITTNYTVTVTEAGCSADAFVTVTVSNCNGVKELVANGISVYPNPTSGILNISISSELAGNTSIEVYDAIGKLVIKETLSTETTTINTTKLTDGIYVFKVINNNQAIKIGKVVKH